MSNSNPKLTLDFSIEDIPWLIHSLSIAVNTAMMCGKEAKPTLARIKEKLAIIKEFYPVLANYDLDEYLFFNTITKIYTCKKWGLYQNAPYWLNYDDEYSKRRSAFEIVYLIIDDTFYPITRAVDYNPNFVKGLKELLDTLVPIEAEYCEYKEGPEKKKW